MTTPAVAAGRATRWSAAGMLAVAAIVVLERTGVPVAAMLRNAATGTGVLLLVALMGGSVVRWVAVPRMRPLDCVLFATAAGTGVLAVVVLALGAVGLLHAPAIVAATMMLAVAGAVHARPWRVVRAALREAAGSFRGPEGLALLAASVLVLFAAIGASAVPLGDWDSLMYHLRIPRLFLEQHRIFLPPDSEHVAQVGAVHMLYVVAAAVGAPQAAVVVSGLFVALLGLATFRVAAAFAGATAGRLAAAGLMGCTVVFFVGVTARTDATLALFVLLAHAAFVRAARGGHPRWLLAAGLVAGVALGTKIHAAVYVAALAPWALVLAARRKLPLRHLAIGAALAAALAAPWLLKNFLLLGDPVFPLGSGHRIPAWLAADERVRAVAASFDPTLVGRARQRLSLAGVLFTPGALSPEPEAWLYVWSALLLVAPWATLASRVSWPWVLPALGYLALLIGRSPYTNLRYFVPVLPALAVGSAAAASALFARLRVPRPWAAAIAVVCLLPLVHPLAYARARLASGRRDAVYGIAEVASRVVPRDGRILMLYDARGWPFDRPVVQDDLAVTWQLLRASGHADDCLAKLGFTHVHVNYGAAGFYVRRAGRPPELADGSLSSFVNRCLEPEAQGGGMVLFRIAPRGRASAAR